MENETDKDLPIVGEVVRITGEEAEKRRRQFEQDIADGKLKRVDEE